MSGCPHLLPRLIAIGLLTFGAAACATSGAVPRPFPGATVVSAPGAPVAPDAPIAPIAPGMLGRTLAAYALAFRNVPYRLGGADPAGFDCSGLVHYVFAQHGISVPRVVEQQFAVGVTVRPSRIEPGDLVFFNTEGTGRSASHVGIAIGGNRFVHAPNATGAVRVEPLNSPYWGERYVGARRITTTRSAS